METLKVGSLIRLQRPGRVTGINLNFPKNHLTSSGKRKRTN